MYNCDTVTYRLWGFYLDVLRLIQYSMTVIRVLFLYIINANYATIIMRYN